VKHLSVFNADADQGQDDMFDWPRTLAKIESAPRKIWETDDKEIISDDW
jgi:hypothetical protein